MRRVRALLNAVLGNLAPQTVVEDLGLGVTREIIRVGLRNAETFTREALAVIDEVEATQPKWTSEPPTEEGWYWVRNTRGAPGNYTMAEVWLCETGGAALYAKASWPAGHRGEEVARATHTLWLRIEPPTREGHTP